MATSSSEEEEEQADAWFHALADRTRRDILRRVLAGEHSVSTLAASYDMSFAAVQKHVAVLERACLLTPILKSSAGWGPPAGSRRSRRSG